jgi:hypothetical protein
MSKRGALSSSQLVEVSTELPEVVLRESVNWTNITFKGKGFAWVNHSENQAMIKARASRTLPSRPVPGPPRTGDGPDQQNASSLLETGPARSASDVERGPSPGSSSASRITSRCRRA